jgi:hypothetical protein
LLPAPARAGQAGSGRGRLQTLRLPASGGGPSRGCAAAQPTVPRHRQVPRGETIDTAACTAPLALSRGTCVSRQSREVELAPESKRVKPLATARTAVRSRAGLSALRPRGPGLQLPSGLAVGPMAVAGAFGAQRLRGGLSKRPRDWLRGRRPRGAGGKRSDGASGCWRKEVGAGSANGVEMVQGPVQTPALTIHRRKRRRRRRRRLSGGT